VTAGVTTRSRDTETIAAKSSPESIALGPISHLIEDKDKIAESFDSAISLNFHLAGVYPTEPPDRRARGDSRSSIAARILPLGGGA